jgi:hypothetical protein
MTTLVANSDLLTPARPDASSNESLLQSDAASSSHPQHQSSAPAPSSNTVTPPDSKDAASLKDDKSIDSTADAATMGNISHSSNINHKTADGSDSNTNKDALSKRGLVSRRGRHVSAGRRTSPRPPSDQLQALAQVTVDAAGNSSGSYDSPMPPKNSVTFSPKKEAGDDSETTANEVRSINIYFMHEKERMREEKKRINVYLRRVFLHFVYLLFYVPFYLSNFIITAELIVSLCAHICSLAKTRRRRQPSQESQQSYFRCVHGTIDSLSKQRR